MGGYLCFRAAAFEPRIARVIASSVAFDYAKFHNVIAEKVGEFLFMHLRTVSNHKMKKMIARGGMPAWMIGNIGLALDVMLSWINGVSSSNE
jgi:hypothetical protein